MSPVKYFRKPRRLVVHCPADHPLVADLLAFGFHCEQGTGEWWRGFTEGEEERLKAAIAKHSKNPTPRRPALPPVDPALVVFGDTYPVRDQLGPRFGCQYNGAVWVAPDRDKAESARLYVALASLDRLGIPHPHKDNLYPPPKYVLCGATIPPDLVARLEELGARFIDDWKCWGIDADGGTTAAASFAVREALGRIAGQPPAVSRGQKPWSEPPLERGAFPFVYFALGVRRAPMPPETEFSLDDRAAVVVASGVEYGKPGEANRVWMHIKFKED